MGITTQSDIQESFLIKSFIHSNTDANREYTVNIDPPEKDL